MDFVVLLVFDHFSGKLKFELLFPIVSCVNIINHKQAELDSRICDRFPTETLTSYRNDRPTVQLTLIITLHVVQIPDFCIITVRINVLYLLI